MYVGKLVFAQLMDHLPLHTFRRCVAHYPGKYPLLSFWRMNRDFALSLIQVARKLYSGDPFGLSKKNSRSP